MPEMNKQQRQALREQALAKPLFLASDKVLGLLDQLDRYENALQSIWDGVDTPANMGPDIFNAAQAAHSLRVAGAALKPPAPLPRFVYERSKYVPLGDLYYIIDTADPNSTCTPSTAYATAVSEQAAQQITAALNEAADER